MRLLIGDIGGTNARLVMYEASADDDVTSLRDIRLIAEHKVVSQMYYKNYDFKSFSEVLCSFMALPDNNNIKVHSCCLAVAGPVDDNRINFTNQDGWIIDGRQIQMDFGIDKVQLINDFVANGHGLLSLSKQELVTLQEGQCAQSVTATQPIALLGAGTGLGECFLTPNDDGHMTVHHSEGGHADCAPRTALEIELMTFLQSRFGAKSYQSSASNDELLPRVSVEHLVSGKGLEHIYEFLREKHPDQINSALDVEYDESNERGLLIGSEKDNYGLFRKALEIMFALFGAEAGNVALKYLPHGGVYIAGGIAPKNIELITGQDTEFMRRFRDKGPISSIMKDFPLYVVLKEDLGLRGAHIIASRLAADLMAVSTVSSVHETNPSNKDIPTPEDNSDTPRQLPNMTLSKIEKSMTMAEALRNAIVDYPVTFAVATSATAAVTAAVVITTLHASRRIA